MKKLKNSLDREGLLKMAENLEICGQNRLEFIGKCRIIEVS